MVQEMTTEEDITALQEQFRFLWERMQILRDEVDVQYNPPIRPSYCGDTVDMNKVERCQEILENMSILTLRPNDILIISVSEVISPEHAENLQNHIREWGVTNRIAILDGGMKIGILREENETT
jgi:hypothetical protein